MDKQKTEILLLIVIAILLIAVVGVLLKPPPEISVSNDEIRGDMHNEAARSTFCKSQGYTEGFVSSGYPVEVDGTQQYKDVRYVGGWVSDYFIVCEKTQIVQQRFEYQDYKRWLIGVGVGNRS